MAYFEHKMKLEEWLEPQNLIIIQGWALDGYTNAEIAQQMGIGESTLYKWRKDSEKLDRVLKTNKEVADNRVKNVLYQKALDGDMSAVNFWLKNRNPNEWQNSVYAQQQKEALELENERKRLELEEMRRMQTGDNTIEYKGIPADFICPQFSAFHFDVQRNKHSEYILPGGRGSTKSSTISLEIIDLIEKNPTTHACICRMVGNTMKDSVYHQIQWAIEKLGLTNEYKFTSNPLEITKKTTGQKIFFRGADDEMKLKGITVPFGSIRILWLEEFDQFRGTEGIRKIEQSVIRGTNEAWIFKSFNPPRSKNNFANEYVREMMLNDDCLIVESCYLDVPPEWLGTKFIKRAEWVKEVNPPAYENEYLGVVNGSGGNVFNNVVTREITDEEIARFDSVVNGVDWGWYPDLYAFVRCQYDSAQSRLYIFDEFTGNNLPNKETAQMILDKGLTFNDDIVICDSASPKDIAEYRDLGINARGAVKGAGSRDYTFKWLAGLKEIVIDPKRCPVSHKEFYAYEYARDKEGQIITGFPDNTCADHCIDAVRYCTETYSRPQATIKA